MRPWRIRVRTGRPALGGLAFDLDAVYVLEDPFWTRWGAWRAAERWKADYERRRPPGGFTVFVDVVHRREVPS